VGVLEHGVSEKSAHNSRTKNCSPPETEAISAENLTKVLYSFVLGLHKRDWCFSLTNKFLEYEEWSLKVLYFVFNNEEVTQIRKCYMIRTFCLLSHVSD
jgi:hypothetical protein